MKIVIISGSYPPIHCGVGDYVGQLSQHLADQGGNEVRVVTSKSATQDSLTLPVVSSWGFGSILNVVRTVRRIRPDIIHLQYPTRPYGRKIAINILPLVLRLRFPKIPLVVTAHEYHDVSLLGKIRIVVTVLLASRIVVTNYESLVSLGRVLPFKRFELIYIGSNIARVELTETDGQAVREKYGLSGRLVLTYFGFIDPSKGVGNLLKAVASFPQEVITVLMTAYDPSDSYHQEIKAQVDSMPGRVTWTDFVPQETASTLLQLSAACVLPFDYPASLRRGSLVTAITHGVPTITTGPVQSPLSDHNNCLVLADNSPQSIQSAVSELFNQPDLGKMIRVNSLDLARDFDWNRITAQHQDLYTTLVA